MKQFVFATVFSAAMLLPGYAQSTTTTHPDSEVGARQERQQQRIAKGARSGQLSPRQEATLEKKEGKIHGEVKQDRAANGGKLTASEKKQVNHQQNKVSKDIHQARHN